MSARNIFESNMGLECIVTHRAQHRDPSKLKRIQKVHNGSYWHTIPERLCYQLQLVSLDLQTRDNAWAVQQLSWFT